MPFEFSLGSFRGQSSYLMRSRRGLSWNNLPPSLTALVRLPGISATVVNFSLGSHGRYWFQYNGENGQVVAETSQNLWPYLRHNPNSGLEITRLEFSQERTFWGTNDWVENEQSCQSIFFNGLPQGLVDQITELDNTGQLVSYGDIGILALGCGNSWVLEWKGWIWSEGIDPDLLAALQVGESATVTVSSPPLIGRDRSMY
ncbi:hypothetical protein C7212DRAFT_216424 [Tuber magnatum]|uniref:Uncharacterized protein n=1 Tax=Tuber magnatum TaxID=42249 RepID=A0A317SJF5_9PEZI|nr:hypothetical protein C7212DRAFT_216424 [Tuber magnatum]